MAGGINYTPQTFLPGQALLASQMNAEVRDLSSGVQGAWLDWSPTWTGLTVGNGSAIARYIRYGKTFQFRVSFVAGSTSAFTASFSFSLPATPRSDYATGVDVLGSALLSRSTAASRTVATAYLGGGSTVGLVVDGHDATNGYTSTRIVGSSVPWTWSAGDTFGVSGSYEAA